MRQKEKCDQSCIRCRWDLCYITSLGGNIQKVFLQPYSVASIEQHYYYHEMLNSLPCWDGIKHCHLILKWREHKPAV